MKTRNEIILFVVLVAIIGLSFIGIIIGRIMCLIYPLILADLSLIVYGLNGVINYAYDLLFNKKRNKKGKIIRLLIGYLILLIILISCLTSIYYSLSQSQNSSGYLTYGRCFDKSLTNISDIQNDNDVVNSIDGTVYFTTITFFSVGYGDICPMGTFRYIAMFNVIIGNFFIVIIIGLAIANFFNNKEDKKR